MDYLEDTRPKERKEIVEVEVPDGVNLTPSSSNVFEQIRAVGITATHRAQNNIIAEADIAPEIQAKKDLQNNKITMFSKRVYGHFINEEHLRTFCKSRGFELPPLESAKKYALVEYVPI